MSKVLWNLLISPAVLGATLVVSASAIAAGTPAATELNPSQTAANIQETEAPVAAQPTAATVAVKPTETTLAQPEQASTAQEVPAAATSVAQAAPEQSATESAPVDTTNLQQILRYSNEGKDSLGQSITNASQFRDVQPSDWAYEALDRIVQKYGCLVGYPDGTYRGNRALSRYEFAAGLNACLKQVEALIASQPDSVSRKDFEALQRLVEEFRTELATLGTRVDNLEGRTQFLEDHQFSTTTKLGGEVIFALTDTFDRYNNHTIFGDRVRLDLRTSFTGRDTLHTRLAAGNLSPFFKNDGTTTINTAEGTQTFNLAPDNSNGVKVDWLAYYFPYKASQVYVAATGGIHSDYAPTLNPYFEDFDGGNGALSTFAQESPIYRIGGGAGAGISLGIGKGNSLLRPTSLTLGYLAGDANNPGPDKGVFNGSYGALAQLNFNVSDRFGLGLTYVHGYHNTGSGIYNTGAFGAPIDGTGFANFGSPSSSGGNTFDRPLSTNSYGVEAAIRPSDKFSISGFVAKTDVRILGRGDGEIWTYGAGVAFPNLGRPGNVLGFFAGVEPTLKGLSVPGRAPGDFNRDNAYHVEGFYKYKLSDNISITPGVIWLTNPGQNAGNNDAVIGTLRTTFTF
jgi:BMFP domain-containing protein YqiC